MTPILLWHFYDCANGPFSGGSIPDAVTPSLRYQASPSCHALECASVAVTLFPGPTFSSASVCSGRGSRRRYAVISTLYKPEILTLQPRLFGLDNNRGRVVRGRRNAAAWARRCEGFTMEFWCVTAYLLLRPHAFKHGGTF